MPQTSNIESTSWLKIVGQSICCLLLIFWTYQLFTSPHPWIFLDNANLLIHETGHLLFTFFGQFIYILGGSLTQCLIPVIALIYFKITQQYFALGFCLFWLGDNLINVAIYIKDAQTMRLPLITGDIHDWNYLLTHLNLLQSDQIIGNFVYILGIISILSGLIACSVLLSISLKNKFAS